MLEAKKWLIIGDFVAKSLEAWADDKFGLPKLTTQLGRFSAN